MIVTGNGNHRVKIRRIDVHRVNARHIEMPAIVAMVVPATALGDAFDPHGVTPGV